VYGIVVSKGSTCYGARFSKGRDRVGDNGVGYARLKEERKRVSI